MLNYDNIQKHRDKLNIVTIEGTYEQVKHFFEWSLKILEHNDIIPYIMKNGMDVKYCSVGACFYGSFEEQFKRKDETPFYVGWIINGKLNERGEKYICSQIVEIKFIK